MKSLLIKFCPLWIRVTSFSGNWTAISTASSVPVAPPPITTIRWLFLIWENNRQSVKKLRWIEEFKRTISSRYPYHLANWLPPRNSQCVFHIVHSNLSYVILFSKFNCAVRDVLCPQHWFLIDFNAIQRLVLTDMEIGYRKKKRHEIYEAVVEGPQGVMRQVDTLQPKKRLSVRYFCEDLWICAVV